MFVVSPCEYVNRIVSTYKIQIPYSKRSKTPVSLFKDQIADKIKPERVNILIDISNKKRLAYLNSKLGKYLDVIVESNSSTNGLYKGISDNYIRLMIRAGNLSKGQRLRVRVISLTNNVLITKPINLST